MKKLQNPWKILGLQKHAAAAQVTEQYRKLASKHHPDKGGNPDKFIMVHQAYEQIKNTKPPRGIVRMEIISSPKELISLLGEKVMLSYKDVDIELLIPWSARVGDTIKVNNILENTDLSVKIKDRHE